MFRKFLGFLLFISCFLCLVGVVAVGWGYNYLVRDLPKFNRVEDYRPAAVSQVFARDGTLVAEFYTEEGRRYPIKIKDIPVLVRNAFLAAEDASFYEHKGIDPVSIGRAIYTNLRKGQASQGGSTITQQVVKNLLLTPEKKFERKAKEALLSYQLESRLSKDEILQLYLNQIFFGNRAYGIKAAAKHYFNKEVADLNLAEAALLAGLPKAPSNFSPITNPKAAVARQRYVLDQMVEANFVTKEEAQAARTQEVKVYQAPQQNIFYSPFYVTEVRRILAEKFPNLEADVDGLRIEIALDIEADRMARKALRKGMREVDKRRGWRGPIATIEGASRENFYSKFPQAKNGIRQEDEPTTAMVLESAAKLGKGKVKILLGSSELTLDVGASTWASKLLLSDQSSRSIDIATSLKAGDVIEVALRERQDKSKPDQKPVKEVLLDQTPEIEGALSLINPFNGEVLVAHGGYDYARSQFNRATQSLRQPGSTFKPLLYLAAIDSFKYSPATIVDDSPRTFKVGDQFWTPSNFDAEFLGPITLRVALEKSRNLVSADLISKIGVDAVIQYAKKLGIESKLGFNLSIALGSSEVTLLELLRAYATFPGRGVLNPSVFIRKIYNRDGELIFDSATEQLKSAQQVISTESAFIMSNLLRGAVESGTGTAVKALNRPVAGKTGTSNDEMDTWFIGFTPQWACGVWIGFDVKRRIGPKETGGRVAAPVFRDFMADFLSAHEKADLGKLISEGQAEAKKLGIEYQAPTQIPVPDFFIPEGVKPYWIYKSSGEEAAEGEPGAILEYFADGTEPNRSSYDPSEAGSYLESPEL
jgi:penicillin-binding protein 1A